MEKAFRPDSRLSDFNDLRFIGFAAVVLCCSEGTHELIMMPAEHGTSSCSQLLSQIKLDEQFEVQSPLS